MDDDELEEADDEKERADSEMSTTFVNY